MPRKNQPGCPCCPSGSTLCVKACGSLALGGASVTIRSGGASGPIVYSGTTGSTGCLAVPVSGAGYTTTITLNGSQLYQGSPTYPSSGTLTINVGSTGLVCCGGYAIPQTLTLTDAAGSISFVYDSTDGLSVPTWFNGHAVTRLSSTYTGDTCTPNPPTEGPVRVCYKMECYGSSSPVFRLTRSWGWLAATPPVWYQDTTGFTPGQFCIVAPPALCGNPRTDTALDSENPSSGSPFAISFTPSPSAGNSTSDPVGGTVAVSQ